MTVYLYARVSTSDQSTEAQVLAAAERWPGAFIVCESASGAGARPMLDDLCDRLGAGDTLVLAALDRLGRRTVDVLARLEDLLARGVRVESLREGPIGSGPAGTFLVQVLAAAAELERNLIRERTKAGLKARREAGVRLGRPPSLDLQAVRDLNAQGLGVRAIAKRLGVAASTISRALKAS
jgi:putative DNA-invertase from lambdoid prophage Rac